MAQHASPASRGFGVVLLAAGESTRMGRPKQLLEWEGRPLVQYQIEQLQATDAREIVVVLGHMAGEIAPVVEKTLDGRRGRIVVNRDYALGKTTSVKAGLRAFTTKVAGIMALAADQPRPANVLQTLMDEHLRHRNAVTVPSFRGKHGHPPLFRAALLPELLAITEEGQGVREVIQRHRRGLREVPFADPLVVININTLEDYKRAKALAKCQAGGYSRHT